MKKRFFAIFIILVFILSGCNQYRYADGKKTALKNIDFFKELVVLCIDNQLKQPIILGKINNEEYENLDKNGKKLLDKCVALDIIDVFYTDYYDEQQKFNYIIISFDTVLSYQGVIFVPNEFSKDDARNLIYQMLYEPVRDLIELDDNLYYYYTDESIEEDYSKEYIFPEGYIEISN